MLTIVNIIFLLCCQLEISDSQFNLYNTEENLMMDICFKEMCYNELNAIRLNLPKMKELIRESNAQCIKEDSKLWLVLL